MPATDQEMISLAEAITTSRIGLGEVDSVRWADGSEMQGTERFTVLRIVAHIQDCRRKPPGQRKAMRLLRSLLNPRQRWMLKGHKYFYVTSKSGATFRFWPRVGHSERVKRHGSRWFRVSSFCLHDEGEIDRMPPADLVVAHMLLIAADEARFLRLANEHEQTSQLWNGEYLRRMRQRHIAG